MSGFNDKEFDEKFSEIMKLENIEDFDAVANQEFAKSVKEYLLVLSTLNQLSQYIYTLLFSLINEEDIILEDEMKENLSTIYKLSVDFIDYMIELTEEDFVFELDDDDDDDDEEEDEDLDEES